MKKLFRKNRGGSDPTPPPPGGGGLTDLLRHRTEEAVQGRARPPGLRSCVRLSLEGGPLLQYSATGRPRVLDPMGQGLVLRPTRLSPLGSSPVGLASLQGGPTTRKRPGAHPVAHLRKRH